MKPRESRRFYRPLINRLFAVSCSAIMLSLGQTLAIAQQAQSPATATTAAAEQAPKISNDQLDSLVAPIALYSDELLAQTLAASTYPLEIIQLQQWMERNKNLKDKALAGRQYPVDDRSWERVPGPTIRRDGRSSAHAREGSRQGHAKNQCPTKSRDQDRGR